MLDAPYISALQEEKGKFNLDCYFRNKKVLDTTTAEIKSVARYRKTGTTICGVVAQNGIVLGADTRATEDTIVADKNCQKLFQLAPNIYVAGAGVSADLHHLNLLIQSKLELLSLETYRNPRIIAAVTMFTQHLFKYRGYIQTAVVLGGVDNTGAHLYNIFPHGSMDRLPFVAMGSGSLNAIAVLESSYKENMTMDAAKELVTSAIRAGISNDLGSGGNVDIVVIPRDDVPQLTRAYRVVEKRRIQKSTNAIFPTGTSPILCRKVEETRKLIVVASEANEDVEM